MSVVEFGEWLPDLPDFQNQGCKMVQGVRPGGRSYLPFPKYVTYSTQSLPSNALGAFSMREQAGNSHTYVGTREGLYELATAQFNDVSRGAGYNTGDFEYWAFAEWNRKVIATNYSDPIQVIDVGGAQFDDLAGNPPRARHIAVVGNFLVLGNIFDPVDGAVLNRVQWSGFENETIWGVDPANQADFNDLEDEGGWIQRIIGGSYGVIIRENSITRMTYIGSPLVFQFDVVERERGTPSPRSVIQVGNLIAYLAKNGFYIFDGNKSVPIGVNKVNQFFFDDFDPQYFDRVVAALDPTNEIIMWAYPGAGALDGGLNRIIMYNYSPNSTKRWSYHQYEDGALDLIFNSVSETYTLESLDNISMSIDDLPYSLDSKVWTVNNPILSGFTTNGNMVNFTGEAENGLIETPEFQLIDGKRSLLTLVRPVIQGQADISMNVGIRNQQSENVVWSAGRSRNSSGDIPCRSNARYHRLRFNTTGDFEHIKGFEIAGMASEGKR